jgi:hypothetical protein
VLVGCLAVLIAAWLRGRYRARAAAGTAGGTAVRGIRFDRRRVRSARAPLDR